MSSCDFPCPDELPLDCLSELVRIVRTRSMVSERQAFCRHAWVVAGYLLRRLAGPATQVPGYVAGSSLDGGEPEQDKLNELSELAAATAITGEPNGTPAADGSVGLAGPGRFLAKWLLEQLLKELTDRFTEIESNETSRE